MSGISKDQFYKMSLTVQNSLHKSKAVPTEWTPKDPAAAAAAPDSEDEDSGEDETPEAEAEPEEKEATPPPKAAKETKATAPKAAKETKAAAPKEEPAKVTASAPTPAAALGPKERAVLALHENATKLKELGVNVEIRTGY